MYIIMVMQYCKLQYACNLLNLKNLKVTALLENGMYASYICIDIIMVHVDYAIIIRTCKDFKDFLVTALLENGMPVCHTIVNFTIYLG